MPALEDLEARVTELETQLRALADRVRHSEQDAAAARVLAGGADRDVTDLSVKMDANRKAINALGEQTAARFDRLEQRVDSGFAEVDKGFAEIRGKLDAAAAGQQQIVTLLSTLIDQHGEQHNDQSLVTGIGRWDGSSRGDYLRVSAAVSARSRRVSAISADEVRIAR